MKNPMSVIFVKRSVFNINQVFGFLFVRNSVMVPFCNSRIYVITCYLLLYCQSLTIQLFVETESNFPRTFISKTWVLQIAK